MPEKIDSLTGLRIFAAVWVMLYHFETVTPIEVWHYPGAHWLVQYGASGVDLFFVLSGYILMHVYGSQLKLGLTRSRLRDFLSYRFARLFPVHLVTLAIMVALFFGEKVLTGTSSGTASRYGFWNMVAALTMTHAWFGVDTPNLPSWSISAEWFAYLLFPVLCWLIYRVRYAWTAFVVVGLIDAFLWQAGHHHDLLRILAGFPLGMALYYMVPAVAARTVGRGFASFAGVLVATGIAVWALVPGDSARLPIALLLFAALIAALARPGDVLGRVLALPVLVYLGDVSYSVYMFHWVARVIVRVGLTKLGVLYDLPAPLIVLAYVITTMIGSILLYHVVEKPGRRWLRRALSSRSTRNPGTTSVRHQGLEPRTR